MMDAAPKASEAECIRTLRIILIALCMGQALFLAVALFIGQSSGDAGEGFSMEKHQLFLILLGALTLITLSSRQVLSPILRKNMNEENLVTTYQMYAIVRAALLEGPGLFGGVVLLITGLNGLFPQEPLSWVCMLPFVFSVMGAAQDWPSEDKYRMLREELKRAA